MKKKLFNIQMIIHCVPLQMKKTMCPLSIEFFVYFNFTFNFKREKVYSIFRIINFMFKNFNCFIFKRKDIVSPFNWVFSFNFKNEFNFQKIFSEYFNCFIFRRKSFHSILRKSFCFTFQMSFLFHHFQLKKTMYLLSNETEKDFIQSSE